MNKTLRKKFTEFVCARLHIGVGRICAYEENFSMLFI